MHKIPHVKKIQEGDRMILRAILGTLVMIFFIIPFIKRIQNDRREGKDISKWSVTFIIIAVVLWLFMITWVVMYYA